MLKWNLLFYRYSVLIIVIWKWKCYKMKSFLVLCVNLILNYYMCFINLVLLYYYYIDVNLILNINLKNIKL